MTLRICIAQLDLVVGDMVGNAERIAESARAAQADGAQLLLTPELSICGYPAEDLLLRPAFVAACDDALNRLIVLSSQWPGLTLVVGHPVRAGQGGGACHNAASVIAGGRVLQTYAKRQLPNYRVFDERRYFEPGQGSCVFQVAGVSVGLLVCEDAWFDAPAELARQAGAELLAVVNASPYHLGKGAEREAAMARRARAAGLPLVYAQLVGAQDEVVFEGRSFAVAADGALAGRARAFAEQRWWVDVTRAGAGLDLKAETAPLPGPEHELWDALVLGLAGYVRKNGFPGVVLGLSGGIDSALVLALAVDALGPGRVHAVMMPSPYTAAISREDARELARRLAVRYDEIPIGPAFDAFRAALAPAFAGRAEDTAEENLQARIRGVLLMALSNKFGNLVLACGNKSEAAVGYSTLYGDMCGGFAPIKDVLKTRVFALARWRNAHDPYGRGASPIPERIITRPPSAELRPGQTDQDSLPPYALLDAIIEQVVENDAGEAELQAAGFDAAVVRKIMRMIRQSEYKRQQAALGTRVTRRAFGKDWRYPVTNKFGV